MGVRMGVLKGVMWVGFWKWRDAGVFYGIF